MSESKAYVMKGSLVDNLSPEASVKVHRLIASFMIKYHDKLSNKQE